MASLSLTMLLASLGTSIANVALPSVAIAFDAGFQATQWVVLAYLLATTLASVGAGAFGDRHGRRRGLLGGLLLFVIGTLAGGVAPSLPLLLVARGVQGLGAALMTALSLALVGSIVPSSHTGRAMGVLGTMSALGTSLGPAIGGGLVEAWGWRAVFVAIVPLGLACMMLVRREIPRDEPAAVAAERPGWSAAALLASTLAAYALSLTLGRGHFGLGNLALLAAAGVGLALLVVLERRGLAAHLHLSLVREPALRTGLVTSALVSAVLMATLVVGPFHLSLALGLAPAQVGAVLAIGPIVAALVGAPAGRVVDRLGARPMLLAGLCGITLGCLQLALLPDVLGLAAYVGPMIVLTAGYAVFQAANNTEVMRSAGVERRGVVAGLLNLARNLGLVTGTALMGAVFALGSGTQALAAAEPSAVATGMHLTFALAAGSMLITLALQLGVPRFATMLPVLAILLVPALAAAQSPVRSDEQGFVLRSGDGRSRVRVLGLIQPQVSFGGPDGRAVPSIHRARLGLVGSLFTPDLRFTLVVDFGGKGPRLAFAHLDYALVRDRLVLRVGQFKRPFSRSFLTLASVMSMIDRPSTIGASVFGDDVDLGVMLHDGGSRRVEWSLGMFGGTDAGTPAERLRPLIATRIGYASPGFEPYRESDLEGGAARFGVGAAGMVELDAEGGSFASAVVDAGFKLHGLALTSAFYVGARQSGPRWHEQRLAQLGHHTQLGYLVGEHVEPVLRYSLIAPLAGPARHDLAGGFNVFVRGHALKWQSFARVRVQEDLRTSTPELLVHTQLSFAF